VELGTVSIAISAHDPTTHDFVPRAFLGMARAFRQKVDTDVSAGTDRIIKSITSPLRRRLQGNASPVFRHDLLIDTERRWQTELPTFGRIMLQTELTKSSLFIREARLSPGDIRFESWLDGQKEQDCGLQQLTVIARTGFCSIEATMLASISIHALSRFYQRSFDNSDVALRTALREIARNHAAVLTSPAPGGKFSIAAGDGRRLGSVQASNIEGKVIRILCVRSFVGQ
jgi:predicted membrane metal-binding protein